jgi:hypothetical protein
VWLMFGVEVCTTDGAAAFVNDGNRKQRGVRRDGGFRADDLHSVVCSIERGNANGRLVMRPVRGVEVMGGRAGDGGVEPVGAAIGERRRWAASRAWR